MSLPAYLANIKSSGIYRFVWDKSEIPNTTAEILRLVVGYSERGPFNTPVYIKSQTEFRSVFGDISKKLERQGCWFHRMALQALRRGPILCLNLKNFKNESVQAVSFKTPQEKMIDKIDLAVKDIYNTNRFWTLEPELLEEAFGTIITEGTETTVTNKDLSKNYITITATDSKETSNTIFIRGYEPKGYDVTFKEWYSSTLNGAEMPSYLEGYENKKLKNFWAEIYVFRGEFTQDIATSDALCKYFDVADGKVMLKPFITNAFGEKKDTLDLLATNDASNFIRKYQGILLPEFQSATGSTLSLDIIFNNDNQLHKMMMRLNQNLLYEGEIGLDKIDTMGWNLHSGAIEYTEGTGIDYSGMASSDNMPEVLSITKNVPVIYQAMYDQYNGEWVYSVVPTTKFASGTSGEEIIDIDVDKMAADFYTYDLQTIGDVVQKSESDPYSIVITDDEIDAGFENNEMTFASEATGDSAGKFKYLGVSSHGGRNFLDLRITKSDEKSLIGKTAHIMIKDPNVDDPDGIVSLDFGNIGSGTSTTQGGDNSGEGNSEEGAPAASGEGTAVTLFDAAYNKMQIESTSDSNEGDESADPTMADVTVTISGTRITASIINVFNKVGIKEGDTFWIDGAKDAEGMPSFLCTVTKMKYEAADGDTPAKLTITFDKDLPNVTSIDMLVKCAGSVTATSINLKPTYVVGYTYAGSKVKDIPGNTETGLDPQIAKNNWINYQLGVLDLKGIRIGLTNRTDVDYRYLVDTFEAFAVPGECHAKLALICKMKFNVLGFINFPNMKSFSKCKSMSFRDSNGFDSKYIAMGNNPMMDSDGVFTLASEDNGASFVSYNTPVILRDPETGVKTSVPSAALVSNDFLDKYDKFLPYSIVAGPKRGRISDPNLIGPEFSFGREDLDNLEPMGVNCMVYVPGKGTYINSNQTAKQNPVSALSKIHIRELCTFLQDEIENMMEYYHWDFNTPNLRQTLKDKADTICDTCYRNSGIYDYINVCDESNNTPEVIDNEMIILSTSIEPSRGAGKMVQELTLYRTGGLRAAINDAQ